MCSKDQISLKWFRSPSAGLYADFCWCLLDATKWLWGSSSTYFKKSWELFTLVGERKISLLLSIQLTKNCVLTRLWVFVFRPSWIAIELWVFGRVLMQSSKSVLNDIFCMALQDYWMIDSKRLILLQCRPTFLCHTVLKNKENWISK